MASPFTSSKLSVDRRRAIRQCFGRRLPARAQPYIRSAPLFQNKNLPLKITHQDCVACFFEQRRLFGDLLLSRLSLGDVADHRQQIAVWHHRRDHIRAEYRTIFAPELPLSLIVGLGFDRPAGPARFPGISPGATMSDACRPINSSRVYPTFGTCWNSRRCSSFRGSAMTMPSGA